MKLEETHAYLLFVHLQQIYVQLTSIALAQKIETCSKFI